MKLLPLKIALIAISLSLLLIPSVSFCEIIEISIKGIDDGKRTTKQKDYNEAVLFAKMQALERAGVEIKSETTVKDLVLQQDLIELKSEAVLLPGYQIIDIGYVADGTYQVVLVGKLKTVKDFDSKGIGQVSDVLGWDRTRWGMTQAEVYEAYKGVANAIIFTAENLRKEFWLRKLVERYGSWFSEIKENQLLLVNYFRTGSGGSLGVTVKGKKLELSNHNIPVLLSFDDENKLKGVTMQKFYTSIFVDQVDQEVNMIEDQALRPWIYAGMKSSLEFMEEQLIAKYGDCKSKDDRSSIGIKHTWIFPSTIIQLLCSELEGIPTLIILSYDKPTAGY